MYYTRIHIQNYKSFLNTGEIKISKGINLIIGQNNVGKTALLELLSGSVNFKPHLNKQLKPRKESKIKNDNLGNVLEIQVLPQELRILIEDKSFNSIYFFHNDLIEYPNLYWEEEIYENEYDGATSTYHVLRQYNEDSDDYFLPSGLNEYLKKITENKTIIRCLLPNQESRLDGIYSKQFKIPKSGEIEVIYLDENNQLNCKNINSEYEVSGLVSKDFFENRIYKFDIHRTVFSGKVGINTSKLEANCTNLSSVLDCFQANPEKFGEYKELVREIFPMIKNISIDKQADSAIRIWLKQSERLDLTVSLEDCGTGVGQVLAMLYVIVSSEEPKVIIIDEPNSFLHPSASRKLVEIFKKYDQHQYIISTHSPELITAADADQILLLTLNEQGQTQVREIDKTKSNGMRDILENIGSKLSDVFGYESILWVEGPTEEGCFPLIIEKLLKKSLSQQAILKVRDTGSFEKKHIQTTLDLYKRLTNNEAKALIPNALGFVFDKENRKEKDITDLKREGKGKIYFLQRRLYENYLLNIPAITSILNKYSLKYEWNRIFEEKEISIFLNNKKSEKDYWDNSTPNSNDVVNWINEIHAAKLLEDLFNHFSETRLEYRKTTHSKELTEWIIENAPHELDELKELLSKFYK